jgi:hypothetical protein
VTWLLRRTTAVHDYAWMRPPGPSSVPKHDGAYLTMLAVLSLQGIEAVMTLEGATAAEDLSRICSAALWPNTVHGR